MKVRLLLLALTLLSITAAVYAAPKRERIDPDDIVPVTKATFFGGAGTEYLVGCGMLDDGRVVVVGSTLGPTFTLPGHDDIAVIGEQDGRPAADVQPLEKAFAPIPSDLDRQAVKAIQNARRSISKAEGNTPFIAVLSPELDRVDRVARLPWNSMQISSVSVAPDGAVYLAGFTGPDFQNIGDVEPLEGEGKKTACLLKVTASLDGIAWAVTMPTDDPKPVIEILNDGNVVYLDRMLRVFSPDGTLLYSKGGLAAGDRAINPVTGQLAVGADRNSGTGREPWRQPYLYIYDAKGNLQARLYETPGIVVGSDFRRLVSDSAIRGLRFDPDGKHLWIAGWSDGGNSIMNLQPFSATERIEHNGLGLNMAGAGATSAGYYLKMDLATYRVQYRTIWSCYFKGPHGSRMYSMHIAPDGSLVTGGTLYAGPIVTPNHLYRGTTETEDWSSGGLRFASSEKTWSGFASRRWSPRQG